MFALNACLQNKQYLISIKVVISIYQLVMFSYQLAKIDQVGRNKLYLRNVILIKSLGLYHF